MPQEYIVNFVSLLQAIEECGCAASPARDAPCSLLWQLMQLGMVG